MPKKTKVSLEPKPFSLINNLLGKIPSVQKFRSSKKFYLIIVVAAVLLIFFYKKSLFIAAMVNNLPVSNLELQLRLNQQFRSQTLNQMINEKIILDEAAKNNAVPTETEVNAKILELENNLGGAAVLDNLLSQQGQTRESIRSQIKVQLGIEKLYINEATVSSQEIDQFLATNIEQLQSTDSASQKKEAEELLKQQKLSQIFNKKFQELRERANIQIF